MAAKFLLSAVLLFQYTISVDVDLAVFNVSVLGKDGRPVTGLRSSDFRVYEDGREQTIKMFQPEETPATVGLVIDNSGSMTNKRRDVITAASAFLDASHPQDERFIVDFNRTAWLALPQGTPFTTDASMLRSTLADTRMEGTTALYDALKLALDHLGQGTRQRKALVLISDGADNGSLSKLDDVLHLAERSTATIYCIGIYDPSQKDRNPGVLKKLAKVTGGEALFPAYVDSLKAVWPRIATAIRGQYTIGYISTNPAANGGYRNVRIVAQKNGKLLDVRTRPGYVAAKNP